jgi:hypothetical protein
MPSYDEYFGRGQGDQKIGRKFAQKLGKIAKHLPNQKLQTYAHKKLNFKVPNIYI